MRSRPPDQASLHAVKVYAVSCLRERAEVWAQCEGFLRPRVMVDRDAEHLPGFEALMYHENAHAVEFHALFRLFVLLFGAITFSIGLSLQMGLLVVAGPVMSALLYVWWRREEELRADAVALLYAGPVEFRGFLYLAGTPRTRWYRWRYGRSIREREERTKRWAIRKGWLKRAPS